MNGISHIAELLSLFDWLVTNEQALSAYLKDRTFGLKVQMILWLAKVSQSSMRMEGTAREILYLFLMTLFGKENIPIVIKLVFQGSIRETETRNEEYDDMEAVLDLLMTIEAGNGNPAKVRFEEWVRQTQKTPTSFPYCWKTAGTLEMALPIGWKTLPSLQMISVSCYREWLSKST